MHQTPGVTSDEFEYVQRVVDGDTLMLGTGERIGLIGINAPETAHLNAEIIRQGYGFAVSSSPPLKYQNEFRRLEHEPREQRRGSCGIAHRGKMANSEKTPVTFQELLVSSLASTDALAKLLIEKGIITQQEFLQKISEESDVSTDAQPNAAMNVDFGLIILEGVTLAVIVFGAFAVFLMRRCFSQVNEATPLGLWLRFTLLLFIFCLLALIEGILLRPYSFFWVVVVVGITLFIVAKIAPKLLMRL